MSATAEHHTAWITTDRSALPGDNIDISVLADEPAGYKGEHNDIPVWQSTGTDPVYYTETTIPVDDSGSDDLFHGVEKTLRDAGWTATEPWEGVETGYVATVARA